MSVNVASAQYNISTKSIYTWLSDGVVNGSANLILENNRLKKENEQLYNLLGSPWQNGFMERFFGSFKLELGNLSQYKDLAQLHEAIALAIYYYNTKRIHTALKMSPAAYAATLNLRKDNVFRKMVAWHSLSPV